MKKIFSGIINRYHYAMESIKNRYPCKIIAVSDVKAYGRSAKVKYQAVTKINIRTSTVKDMLDDSLLVEKFHPTDGVKLGFLACGELLLKDCSTLDEAKEKFHTIIEKMLPNTN